MAGGKISDIIVSHMSDAATAVTFMMLHSRNGSILSTFERIKKCFKAHKKIIFNLLCLRQGAFKKQARKQVVKQSAINSRACICSKTVHSVKNCGYLDSCRELCLV